MLVPSDYADRRIAVVGCGYVGLTLCAVMADVGFDVTGVEIREDVLAGLKRGEPQFHEPGLEAMLTRLVASGRLRFVRRLSDADPARVYIVTVGTPLDAKGRARLDMVESVAREVAGRLCEGDMVVMRSTLKLGTTRNVAIPILDTAAVPYDIAFCPERTIEGLALPELRVLPQIVAGQTLAATVRASQLFQFLTPTTVRVSSIEAAEMIKLVDNAQRDVHFAFANEIARMCDVAGIAAAEVIKAGKLGYPRTNLPMPGPVGGPCLSKDPYILAESFENTPVVPEIVVAARRINERQADEAAASMRKAASRLPGFSAKPSISFLGLAFKGRPATDDLRGTPARSIVHAVARAFPGAALRGWDEVVPAREIAAFGLAPASSLQDAFAGADLAIVCNNHPAFEAMPIETLARTLAAPGLIYDFWNNFDPRRLELPEARAYVPLGGYGVAAGLA
jgi:UDP-N-acetyl-D-mannosaminuronic acid dehydrogenase